MRVKEEIIYIVIGRPPVVSTAEVPKTEAAALFDAIELAADYARSLSEFRIYRGSINRFEGAELIAKGSATSTVEWVAHSEMPKRFQSLFATSPISETGSDDEAKFREEEHLDWEV